MAAHGLDLAPFWLRLLTGFGAGMATWIVAADYGDALVSRFLLIEHPAGRLGVAAALGYAAIGSAVALLGLIGEINVFTVVGLLACALLFRVPTYLHRLRSAKGQWLEARSALPSSGVTAMAAIIVIVLAVITGLVNAALPAVWWDPIAYHLPLVSSALRQGAFWFDPRMVQTGFPQLGEAAAIPAYALAGSAGAAMVTLGAGLCVATLVWALADGMYERSGVLAAMFAVSSAVWAWLAPSFYVDVPFAMFVLAALIVAQHVRPIRQNTQAPQDPVQTAALAGVACGAAAAVKYPGLGAVIIVGIFLLWMAEQKGFRLAVPFVSASALIAGPWYVRSWLLAGDPVYPFGALWFAHTGAVRDFGMRYADMTRHWCGGSTSLGDLISLPYRLVVDPRSFCGDPGFALRVAIVFALAALVFVPRARALAVVGAALMLSWFFTSQQWRFLLPALFIYSAIAAAGIAACGPRLRIWGGMAMAALGCLTVLTNWVPAWQGQASASIVPALRYIAAATDADSYLETRLETFAAARWLSEFGFDGSQIVSLDDVRDYYMPTGTSWANPYYQQATELDWSTSTKMRYRPLIDMGKIYLVVNENNAYLRRTPTGVDWAVFDQDRRHGLREIFSRNGVYVFDMSALR